MLALLFIRVFVLDGNSSTRIWFLVFLGVLVVPTMIHHAYIFLTTNLKPRYVVVDEDKITIPEIHSFSDDHKFSYARITHLEIVEQFARFENIVWIYIESGKHRKAKIFKSMLESEAVFLEIYNAVKEKVNTDSCNVPPPRFRLF